ncbi:MAG TPA: DUF3306 domain-containing protein [Burkholderiales bacterium]|nr:DUF3306 domain-containing protein [Burkholderiales bacterium]
MSDEAKDPFVARWSRRKVAARRGEALAEPAVPQPPPAPPPAEPSSSAAPEPAVELPSLDTLKGLESDYKAFLQPEVDPATRSAALRKLFGDPHFNTMDRLDVYIDDYSIPDPIPAAMLKTLSAARSLGLFDKEDEADEADDKQQAEAASPPVTTSASAAPAVPETLPPEAAPPGALDAVAPAEPVDAPRNPEAA